MQPTIRIPALLLMVTLVAGAGCQYHAGHSSSRSCQVQPLAQSLVLPGEALAAAWPSEAADRLNHRRNAALGADRLPVSAAVNVSQIRVWDQQWILNGRPMDTYVRTTQSVQRRDQP